MQPRKSKQRKTKLAWFSRLLQHSARKRGGLILLCSRADTEHNNPCELCNSLLV